MGQCVCVVDGKADRLVTISHSPERDECSITFKNMSTAQIGLAILGWESDRERKKDR